MPRREKERERNGEENTYPPTHTQIGKKRETVRESSAIFSDSRPYLLRSGKCRIFIFSSQHSSRRRFTRSLGLGLGSRAIFHFAHEERFPTGSIMFQTDRKTDKQASSTNQQTDRQTDKLTVINLKLVEL